MEQRDKNTPEWLNQSFLINTLQEKFHDKNICIKNFTVKSTEGEGYCSVIHRVRVQFTEEPKDGSSEKIDRDLSLLIKTSISKGTKFDQLISYDIYDKEIEFYDEIAPKIVALLKKLGGSDQLLPTVYGVSKEHLAMVLEDMVASGYKIKDDLNGFDDATIIFEKIAKVYAASAVLQEHEPDVFRNFKHGVFTRKSDVHDGFYIEMYDNLIEVTSTWPDFEIYTKKLSAMRDRLIPRAQDVFDADPNHFNTLIQGDLQANNMLVKYSGDNKIENVVVIDWAYACWTSPGVDLNYFLNVALKEPLRPEKFDDLLAVFHASLSSSLSQLGYKKHIPTFDEFKRQFVDKIFYGFVGSCLIQPFLVNENRTDAYNESLIGGDDAAAEFKKSTLLSPRMQTSLRKMIPYFDQLGVFD